MIAAAIGLALAGAAIHGTWNVLVKVSGDPISTFRRAIVAAALAATVCAVPAWFWFGRPALSPAAAGWCLVSASLETVYLWLLSIAYRRGDLSAAYPIARGSAPLIAVAIALVLLHENLTQIQLLGVGLLLAGIVGVTATQLRGGATLPALLTGVTIALYTSVDRVGVRLAAPWLYGWLLFVLMAIQLAVSLRIANRWLGVPAGLEPPVWRRAALIGVFMWAAYLLVLLALSVAPLAVVAPVRESSIVAVAAWGVWRLRERAGAAIKLSGAAAVVAGIALLAA